MQAVLEPQHRIMSLGGMVVGANGVVLFMEMMKMMVNPCRVMQVLLSGLMDMPKCLKHLTQVLQ